MNKTPPAIQAEEVQEMFLSGSNHTHWVASAGISGACNAPRRGALVGGGVWAPPTHKRIRVRERVGLAVRLGETGEIVGMVRGRLWVRQCVQGHGVAVRLGESGGIEPGWSTTICGLVNVSKDTGWWSGWARAVRSARNGP